MAARADGTKRLPEADRLNFAKRCKPRRAMAAIGAAVAVFPVFTAAPARAELVITPIFDSTITDDPNAAAIENTINQAIQVYETTFTNNIDVTIDYQEMTSGLGESSASYYGISYSTFLSDFKAEADTPNQATALARLPNSTTNPVTGTSTIDVKLANIFALGITGNFTSSEPGGYDGVVGLNTSLTFPPNPNNGSNYSLLATAEHETDEVLGLGSALPSPNKDNPFPEDLYRYTSTGTRNFTTSGNDAYFSINGTTDIAQFNQQAGADYGDWATGAQPLVQDAFGTPGASPTLGTPEITALDVIGYNTIVLTSTWNTGSGSWSTAGNWTASGTPGAADSVYINETDGFSRAITYDYTGTPVTLNMLTVDLTNYTGTASTVLNMAANNLTADGEYIGYNGSGTINQSGGTNTIVGGNGVYLGENAGAFGTYLLSAAATLSVTGSENVGFDGIGNFNQTGGKNSVLGTSNALTLGTNISGTGFYSLSGTGSISAVSEIVGNLGEGFFSQSGGTNSISAALALYLGNIGGANGSYTLTAGSLTASGYELVGYLGSGTFNQTGGINTITGGVSALFCGYAPGSSGAYYLSGTGTVSETFSEDIGFYGTGVFNQSGGTNTIVSGFNLNVGYDSGADGSYILSGGTITVGNGVFLSGSTNGVGGVGTLNVSGGVLNIGTSLTAYNVPGTAVVLSGGTINTPGLNLEGNPATLHWTGGTLDLLNSVTFDSTASSSTTGGAFGSSITLGSNQTLIVTGNETIAGSGSFGVTLNSGATNVVAAGDSLFLAANTGSTATYLVSGGTLTAANVYVGGTNSAAGGTATLTVNNFGTLSVTGTLEVWNRGRVNLSSPITPVGKLTITGNGIVNLNGGLAINYGTPGSDPITTIVSYLSTGYAGGAWTGTSGIISTSAAGSTSPTLSLGYADGNTDINTPAAANQVLVKLTLAGDANLDGNVNFNDLDIVGQHLNTTGNDWAKGNFTYDPAGAVNFNDLAIIGQNLNQTINNAAAELGGTIVGLGGIAPVQDTIVTPEPTAFALAAIAASGLLPRRWRRRA
jgi:hypothetical protein